MYGHTVVQPNELQMNLQPVIGFTESLKRFCTKDKAAAKLLDVHTEALKSVATATKTPEQIQLNITNLEKIKAMLAASKAESNQQKLTRQFPKLYRYGVVV